MKRPNAVKPSSKTSAKKPKAKPSPKKTKGATNKKESSFSPRKGLTAPNTKVMIQDAIAGLKDKDGSSVSRIKKFIAAAYKVDADAMLPDIKKNISAGMRSGTILQSKGAGFGGTFILANSAPGRKMLKSTKSTAAKELTPKKKSPAAKKSSPAAKKKSPAAKKIPAVVMMKTPKKKSSKTLQMVIDAISALKEKNGSTANAIKSFILHAHGKDIESSLIDINQCLKAAALSGILTQPNGSGPGCTYSLADSTNESESSATKKTTPKKKLAAKKSPSKKKTPKKAATKAKKSPTKAKKKPAKSKKTVTKKSK